MSIQRNHSPLVWPVWALAFLLVTFLIPGAAQAELPTHLDKVHFDWVCVTDASLVEAIAPLAAYRADQGLAPLVVSLDEVIRWSPAGEDTLTTLRWLVTVAANQWGAEYLLLGGSHALLPAPIHRLEHFDSTFDNPTDAYYRCLDGQWDVDGDGLYAEWEDDAAEPTVHITVGRIPADDALSVSNLVAKIIAFENRPQLEAPGALFVASLMDPNWTPGDPYPNVSLRMAMALRDLALALNPDLRAGTLFEDDQWGTHQLDILNRWALVDSLSGRAHDLVYFQLNGAATGWELAQWDLIEPSAFEPLEYCGHTFLATMVSGAVADTRGVNMFSTLLTLPEGGAVGVVAPTGMGYQLFHAQFQDLLWTHLLDGSCTRLGDAFNQALVDFLEMDFPMTKFRATNYWYFGLLGDPATLLATESVAEAPLPQAVSLDLRAVPNPFNPATAIHFNLALPQTVLLEVFDLQGRKVATLLDRKMEAGHHAVPWNDAPASGLYFARITTGATTHTLKLTLIE